MGPNGIETMPIRATEEVVLVRQAARNLAIKMGFSIVDQTKIVTAASELARNALIYGGGGVVTLQVVEKGARRGLKMIFEDKGPGIPDIELAMKDGYTTGSGLGLGLSGSKRLMSEFELISKVGEGTRVTIVKWK